MVPQQVVACRAAHTHGDAAASRIIVLLHRRGAPRPFEVGTDVRGGRPVHRALDPVAVAVPLPQAKSFLATPLCFVLSTILYYAAREYAPCSEHSLYTPTDHIKLCI